MSTSWLRSGRALAGLFVCSSLQLLGQWSGDSTVNTAIVTATGSQTVSCTLGDGIGGAVVFWTDARSGNNDCYAQHIDGSGAIQWSTDGDSVCMTAGDQNNPMAVSDGSGGFIVTWWDTRNSSYDIYAQRINSSGVIQWTAGGVPLCTAAGAQSFPTIVSDGSGGAIITWDDSRSGGSDVYAQRINGSGTVQWTADGVPVCAATGNQTLPIIVGDGSGGAVIAWTDARGVNYDIYAQRLNASGDTLWAADGVVISAATAMQRKPAMIGDGSGGAILVWESQQNGSPWDLYAQRVNAGGVVQWVADGIALVTASDDQTIPVITADGSGGAIIAWSDFRTGTNADIYAQRVNASGVKQWSSSGVGIVTLASNQSSPVIESDGAGGAIIGWNDVRSGNTDIYTQRVDGSGNALWVANGVAVCAATGSQDLSVANNRNTTVMVGDGNGGAIIVWNDPRSGAGNDLYAQNIAGTSVLPVELKSFTACAQNGDIELRWKTASEVNTYGFEIERGSPQVERSTAIRWDKAGFVEGSGTTAVPKEYSFIDHGLTDGTYSYRLRLIDRDGSAKYSATVNIAFAAAPLSFSLAQNFPNPFNPSTTIGYRLATHRHVTLRIFDTIGREVATLVNEVQDAGNYSVTFDAAELCSGIYVSRLQSGDQVQMKKMLLLK